MLVNQWMRVFKFITTSPFSKMLQLLINILSETTYFGIKSAMEFKTHIHRCRRQQHRKNHKQWFFVTCILPIWSHFLLYLFPVFTKWTHTTLVNNASISTHVTNIPWLPLIFPAYVLFETFHQKHDRKIFIIRARRGRGYIRHRGRQGNSVSGDRVLPIHSHAGEAGCKWYDCFRGAVKRASLGGEDGQWTLLTTPNPQW